jgi:membrane protease YdiL (CAAX protease family)
MSIIWAYAWIVPTVIALKLDPVIATLTLTVLIAAFIARNVVRPLRSQPRRAAQLRLRPVHGYLPWLTLAVGVKLVLVVSTVVLHEQLATWRLLPRLPDDPDFVSAAFLAHPFGLIALLLAAAILGPLIEEFAFRGRMLHDLEHSIGVVPAIVLTGTVFSLMHGTLDAVHHLVFGIFAGWVVWRTGSIWSGVYMHCLNNAAAVALVRLTSDWNPSERPPPAWLWPYAVVAGVLAIGALLLVARFIHRAAQHTRPRASAWSRERPAQPAMTLAL